jgi:MFS family permease
MIRDLRNLYRDIRVQYRNAGEPRGTFTALRHRNFQLWFQGQLISLFGSWMQSAAQAFLIFEMTKSNAYLGLFGFATGIPSWIFMLYAGVVTDRMSRRKLMVITQTAMMILAFLTAGLTFAHLIRPWHLILIAFGFGVANAFDAPPRQALVQELVAREDMTNAIALNGAMFNLSIALGPAVGGLTYALFGPAWCFMINGLSFIAVIIALLAMKLEPFKPRPHQGSVMAELKEGLVYVWRHSIIRNLTALVGVLSLFGLGIQTLMPSWSVNILHGHATLNGLLLSARGVGALIGALMIASLGRFTFGGRLMTVGSMAFPLLIMAFAFLTWPSLALLCLVLVGFAQILVFNLANASVQSLTPDALRGRVMSVYSLIFFGAMPLGSLFIGGMAEKFGEPPTVLVSGLIVLAYSIFIYLAVPKIRKIA